MSLLAYYTN